MPADEPDLYAILGVAADASPAHIAHAYRRLIRAGHPDHHPHADTAALTTVAAAYAILRDPARRAAYDQTRRPHHNQQPPPPPPPPQRPRAVPDLRAGPVRRHPK